MVTCNNNELMRGAAFYEVKVKHLELFNMLKLSESNISKRC